MKFISLAIAALVINEAIAANQLPQGGGMIYPSWRAQYWANPKLAGQPAWEKLENRIAFDWEDWRPVLGIHAESVRHFPTDNFSARFTGTLVARFSEEYTIVLESDEGARLKIRPHGSRDCRCSLMRGRRTRAGRMRRRSNSKRGRSTRSSWSTTT